MVRPPSTPDALQSIANLFRTKCLKSRQCEPICNTLMDF